MPSPLSTFFMRVQGDAMRGDGILHGDLLVIDRSLYPQAGSVVVAVFEGRFIVRRLCPCPRGPSGKAPSLRLEASDGEGLPIPLDNDQGGAEIWGVVIHAVHHLMAPPPGPRSLDLRRRGGGRKGP